VPGEPVVTTPEDAPIFATDVVPLAHVPPAGVLVRVDVLPSQIDNVPDIVVGSGFTVIVVVVMQAVGSVYVTTDTPALLPVTIPVVAPTDSIDPVAPQVPPDVADERVILPPTHMAVLPPIMGVGSGFTVITVDCEQPIGPIA